MSHETNTQNSEQTDAPDSRLRRFTRSKTGKAAVGAVAVVIAAGAALGGVSAHNKDVADTKVQAQEATAKANAERAAANFTEQQKAAEAIAQRFDCTLTQVSDFQQSPPPQFQAIGGGPRDSVLLDVGIAPTQKAQPYLDKYVNDPSVVWEKPAVRAYINSTNPNTGKVEGNNFTNQIGQIDGLDQPNEYADGYTTSLYDTVYPQTAHTAGTTATISVQQMVRTFDPQGNEHDTTGEVNCGTIEFNGQTWQMTTQTPPESPSLIYNIIPAYSDGSH